ncbi:MAG TPA: phosphatidylinositol-specific phospholipase C/glycerophosphodiester phosphodiesterase family protein [Chitinophagaceae bacterium]|jgi:alkaline phosphatase
MKYLLLPVLVCWLQGSQAQPVRYTTANAHSHNDYEQKTPFFLAYDATFGSIEADIFLHNDSLIVGHTPADLVYKRTLQSLYLDPLLEKVKLNKGNPYKDPARKLQMMIDVKTGGVVTLGRLVEVLKQYPALIHSKNIQFAISGNRPPDSSFTSWPSFIWFDGELYKHYSDASLSKIVMLSDNIKRYTRWNGRDSLPAPDDALLDSIIRKAHELKKTVRFWDAPDMPAAWDIFTRLHVDYINTDHIQELSAWFKNR